MASLLSLSFTALSLPILTFESLATLATQTCHPHLHINYHLAPPYVSCLATLPITKGTNVLTFIPIGSSSRDTLCSMSHFSPFLRCPPPLWIGCHHTEFLSDDDCSTLPVGPCAVHVGTRLPSSVDAAPGPTCAPAATLAWLPTSFTGSEVPPAGSPTSAPPPPAVPSVVAPMDSSSQATSQPLCQ